MSANTDRQADPSADREIVSSRVFAAPRERVFRAFSDAGVLAQWWGPKGFTSTFHEFDLRPGGAWRFVMRGPDGTEYHNASEFLEVVPPEELAVYLHRVQEVMKEHETTASFLVHAGSGQS